MDLAQSFSVNTVCKVNWYRGFDPSINMNKIHLSVSLDLSLSLSLFIYLFFSCLLYFILSIYLRLSSWWRRRWPWCRGCSTPTPYACTEPYRYVVGTLMSIHNPFNLPLKREDVFDIRDSYWSTGQLKSTLDFKWKYMIFIYCSSDNYLILHN